MNTTADRYAHARESLAEARAALAKVVPPSSPEQDRDGLYYPLLFLCETVAPVLDALGSEPSEQTIRLCANHMHGCTQPVEADTAVVGVTAGGAELLFCSERCKAERNRG